MSAPFGLKKVRIAPKDEDRRCLEVVMIARKARMEFLEECVKV